MDAVPFLCPRCAGTSFHPSGAPRGWCTYCSDFTGPPHDDGERVAAARERLFGSGPFPASPWSRFADLCASGRIALPPDLSLLDELNQFRGESVTDSAALIPQAPADDPGEDWNLLGYPLDDSARWYPGCGQ